MNKRLVVDVSEELHRFVMMQRYKTGQSAGEFLRALIQQEKMKQTKKAG